MIATYPPAYSPADTPAELFYHLAGDAISRSVPSAARGADNALPLLCPCSSDASPRPDSWVSPRPAARAGQLPVAFRWKATEDEQADSLRTLASRAFADNAIEPAFPDRPPYKAPLAPSNRRTRPPPRPPPLPRTSGLSPTHAHARRRRHRRRLWTAGRAGARRTLLRLPMGSSSVGWSSVVVHRPSTMYL